MKREIFLARVDNMERSATRSEEEYIVLHLIVYNHEASLLSFANTLVQITIEEAPKDNNSNT